MASSGNFCTMNTLVKGTENVSSGNCKLDMTTNNRGALGNYEIPLTGKWYFECFAQMGAGVEGYVGISDIETDLQSSRGGITDSNMYGFGFSQYSGSNFFSIKVTGGTADTAGRIDEGTTNNAVLGIAINRDDDEIKLYTNNTLRFTLSISATTLYYPFFGVGGTNNSSYFMYLNAGPDSTFGGNKTAGGNADENGFGDFFYSPPTGFLALCSANLPISADIDPAGDNGADENPTKQFNVVTWTGDGTTSRSISVGLQPDFIWFKSRSSAFSHRLYDTSRGINSNGGKRLFSNSTGAEVDQTSGQDISAVGSDGFTTGASDDIYTNDTNDGGNHVAWCWRANGGVTSSNTDGSITSTVQANTKAGFSIITYTGNGSGGATFGHGLSAKPDFFIVKSRSGGTGRNWAVYHSSQGATKYVELDSNGPFFTSSLRWNNTEPTNSLISLGTTASVNANTENFVCYAWHSVEGYSKFGSFEGNSNADGPFIYTGFRPRLVFCKAADASENWQVRDTARSPFNADSQVRLYWNSNAAEGAASTASPIDFLSNGFKVRGSNSEINTNTIVFGAWGDVPFKYNNTF